MTTEKLKEALGKLDPANVNHWTAEGLPRLDTLRLLSQTPGISREDVENAAPGFNQKSAAEAMKPPEAPKPPEGDSTSTDTAATTTSQTPALDLSGVVAPAGLETTKANESELQNSLGDSDDKFDRIADLEETLDQMRAQHARNAQSIVDAQTELDVLYEKRAKLSPPDHLQNQTEIRRYLDSQQKQRAERSGGEISDLDISLQHRRRSTPQIPR